MVCYTLQWLNTATCQSFTGYGTLYITVVNSSTCWAMRSSLLSRVFATLIFPLSLYTSTPPQLTHTHTHTHTRQNKQTSALSRVYELGSHVCQLIDYSGIPLCGLTCPMQEIGSGRF